jgi:polyferredoxin
MDFTFDTARFFAKLALEAAYQVLDDFDRVWVVRVTKNGDELQTANTFGSPASQPLRVLRHRACGRKVTLQKIGRVGFLWGHVGTAIICEKCAFRLEVSSRIRTVGQLRNHFIRFNL